MVDELLLPVRPIGVIRSPHQERADAPRQPRAARGMPGTIELFPGHGYEDATADLEGWQYIWVIAWFDRNPSWRPKVLPPRSDKKRGVFSTRSPHRPNPLALSVFELVSVDGLVLEVRDVDLLDGTPVLDIKPYVPWTDAIPDARTGWLERQGLPAGERPPDPGPAYEVTFAPLAEAGLALLSRHGIDLRERVVSALSIGPQPHAYRRIRKTSEGFCLGVKDIRVHFVVEGRRVTVRRIGTGHRGIELARPENDVHRALVALAATWVENG